MSFRRQALFILSLPVLAATPAAAQLITVRTVPMSQGDQFDFFPSHNLAMGGLSIALADTLLDPFSNPATASRTRSRIFTSPGTYSVSAGAGSGRTLPLGAFLRSGAWFGVAAAALQQVDAARSDQFFPILNRESPPIDGSVPPQEPQLPPIVTSSNLSTVDPGPGPARHGNMFLQAMLGRQVSPTLSIAGSLSWAGLRALDGVDLMYEGARRVDQSGHSFDARIGLLSQLGGNRSLQAVLVHNRYDMTHDVTYMDNFWDPATQQIVQFARGELNQDQTNTWGAHVQYMGPIAATGWQGGLVFTVNHMSHPKIPNYALMSIPRDPGYSNAFNVGFGVAKRDREATFGAEFMLEPIWSHTWADAAAPIATTGGGTIPTGGRTIENRFAFMNWLLRLGIGRDFELGANSGKSLGIQMGMVARAVRYHLRQDDHVAVTARRQNESWTEWSPTWGLSFAFPEFELRYRGSVTNGGGRPVVQGFCDVCRFAEPAGGGIVVAPNAPLSLGDVTVTSHQFSLSLPLARTRRTGGDR